MTMADTVAVMNQGRIEQLGAPQELYDAPRTAFAANFLGQSNLVPGTVVERGEILAVQAFGQVLAVPAAKVGTTSDRVILGVRPEKLHLSPAGEQPPAGRNVLTGTVTDRSFVGVSTQYLITMPWGQEIIAFEQNLTVGARPVRGDEVVLSWDPEHTFGLDGSDDLTAGIDGDLRDVGPWTAADAAQGLAPVPGATGTRG